MRTALALSLLVLAGCIGDDFMLPPITTGGGSSASSTSSSTASETSTGADEPPCPAAYDCIVLGVVAACIECESCPGDADRLGCKDYEACVAQGYDKCACHEGACIAGGDALGKLPCLACQICGGC